MTEIPASNLEQQIQRHHPDECTVLTQEKLSPSETSSHNNYDNPNPQCKNNEPVLKAMYSRFCVKSKIIKVKIEESTLLTACLELVTVNGRFRLPKILNPLLEGFAINCQ